MDPGAFSLASVWPRCRWREIYILWLIRRLNSTDPKQWLRSSCLCMLFPVATPRLGRWELETKTSHQWGYLLRYGSLQWWVKIGIYDTIIQCLPWKLYNSHRWNEIILSWTRQWWPTLKIHFAIRGIRNVMITFLESFHSGIRASWRSGAWLFSSTNIGC